jgi:muconolactone delta-isomerase
LPLQPGEWRSLGLFAAGDAGQLQRTLASMPLKIWRTDQVTPLAPHPNDPGPSTRPAHSRALDGYQARDSAEMEAIVKALPLDPWMTTKLTPLTPHPSDPATRST